MKLDFNNLITCLDEIYATKDKSQKWYTESVYNKIFELIQPYASENDNESTFSLAKDIVSQLQILMSDEGFLELKLLSKDRYTDALAVRHMKYKVHYNRHSAKLGEIKRGIQALFEDEVELLHEPLVMHCIIMQALNQSKIEEKPTQKTPTITMTKKVQPPQRKKMLKHSNAYGQFKSKQQRKMEPVHIEKHIENKDLGLELERLGKRLSKLAKTWFTNHFSFPYCDPGGVVLTVVNFKDAVSEGSLDLLESFLTTSVSTKEAKRLKSFIKRNYNPFGNEVIYRASHCKSIFLKTPSSVYSQACMLIEKIQTLDNLIWERIIEHLKNNCCNKVERSASCV